MHDLRAADGCSNREIVGFHPVLYERVNASGIGNDADHGRPDGRLAVLLIPGDELEPLATGLVDQGAVIDLSPATQAQAQLRLALEEGLGLG